MVWIQIRTEVLLVLIWVQTVCKGYQQTTKVAANKERVLVASIQTFRTLENKVRLRKKYFTKNLNCLTDILELAPLEHLKLVREGWPQVYKTFSKAQLS